MGQGGYLQLLNATPYRWVRDTTVDHPYQFESFNIQDVNAIEPGTTATAYIEFNQSLSINRSNTEGKAAFSLVGTPYRIGIGATDSPMVMKVRLEGFSSASLAEGQWYSLGWNHDGNMTFILRGEAGSFTSTPFAANWMERNMATLGSCLIRELCMPGTYDSGMSELHTPFPANSGLPGVLSNIASVAASAVTPGLIRTQSGSVYRQLLSGARYLDIRPVLCNGEFLTGHYSTTSWFTLGAAGQTIAQVIQDIDKFTLQYKELIILNLSHGYCANESFREFKQAEWISLFAQLKTIQRRFTYAFGDKESIVNRPLDFFLKNGAAVLIYLNKDVFTLDSSTGAGFISKNNLNIDDVYSNTMEESVMRNDQLAKICQGPTLENIALYEANLTVSALATSVTSIAGEEVTTSFGGQSNNFKIISELAKTAGISLYRDVLLAVSKEAFPNIFIVDFIDDNGNAAGLAMAINAKVYPKSVAPPVTAKPKYLSSLVCVLSGKTSIPAPNAVYERNTGTGNGNDINNGFGGDYSWIVAQYTEDSALAVTNIIITIQGKAIGGKIEMATGAGGDFRYIDYSVNRGNRDKIQSIYLWRSKKSIGIPDLNAQGLNGMSIDIDKGRSGDYLYLVWKTAVV